MFLGLKLFFISAFVVLAIVTAANSQTPACPPVCAVNDTAEVCGGLSRFNSQPFDITTINIWTLIPKVPLFKNFKSTCDLQTFNCNSINERKMTRKWHKCLIKLSFSIYRISWTLSSFISSVHVYSTRWSGKWRKQRN